MYRSPATNRVYRSRLDAVSDEFVFVVRDIRLNDIWPAGVRHAASYFVAAFAPVIIPLEYMRSFFRLENADENQK